MPAPACSDWRPAVAPEAIVVGCSAGGLQALSVMLAGLDPDLPASVVVVCHTGAEDIALLCELLARHSRLPVEEAGERQPPRAGTVHLAPAGYHLLVERSARFALSVDPKICYCRPAIDVLFQSAADCWRDRLAAVVLTGANEDGAAGLKAVRARSGIGIVQLPAEAEVATMPEAALRVAGADHILPLAQIAPLINRLCLP